jgi:hypothetical protein
MEATPGPPRLPIHALRFNGKERIVPQLPGILRLHVVSRDGRILLSREASMKDSINA